MGVAGAVAPGYCPEPGKKRRGSAIAVTLIAVLAASFAVGNLLGRSTTAPPPAPPPAAGPATIAGPPDPTPTPEPVDPVVRPPLTGTGPYGTSRVTGADFIALTFDDGPDPHWTPQVLQLLYEHGVTATFCVLGELAAAHPHLIQQIVQDGHTLCNHSWDHDNRLGSRSPAVIRADLARTNAAIWAAAPGAEISYYRQPGGLWTERVVAVAAELGMSSLHWAVDPQDWRQVSPRMIAATVVASPPGAIVLLHDGGGERAATVDALRLALPELVDRHRVAALPPAGDQLHAASGRA